MNILKNYYNAQAIVKNENSVFDFTATEHGFSQNTHLYVKISLVEGLDICNIKNAKLRLLIKESGGEDKLLLYPVLQWNAAESLAVRSDYPIAFSNADSESTVCEFDFTDAVEKILETNSEYVYEICAQNANLSADLSDLQVVIESEKPSQMIAAERAQAFDFCDKLSVFVDKKYGNMMLDLSLCEGAGSLMPVNIRNMYNSALYDVCYNQSNQFDDIAPFTAYSGNGFKLSVLECIKRTDDSTFVYTDIENCKTLLTKSEQNPTKYIFEDSVFDSETNTLTLDGQTLVFDQNGFIVSKTDIFGNSQSFTYSDNKLTSVTDGRGKTYLFAYNELNMLTSVTDPCGKVTTLEYLENVLYRVTYPDGGSIVLYSEKGYYTSIVFFNTENIDQKNISFEILNGRVHFVYDGGKNYEFEYSLVSNKSVITKLSDDYYLQTVCVFESSADLVNEYSFERKDGVLSPIQNIAEHNFASDSSFENESWYKYGDDTESIGYNTSAAALYGTKCLEITSETDSIKGVYRNVNNLAPGIYTLSAYFRADSKITNGGAFLRVTSASGNILAQSESINYTAGEFVRSFATFEITSEQRVNIFALMSGSGKVFCDAIMLCRGEYPRDYNLITNPDFEKGTESWQSETENFGATATEFLQGGKSLAILGSLDSVSTISTSVSIKPEKTTRESFTLTGYAKAPHAMQGADFAIEAKIVYDDGETEVFTADFLPKVDEWQKTELSFCKSQYKAVSELRVSAVYGGSAANAYFDCISLVRDSIETNLTASDFETDTDYPVYSESVPDTDDFEEVMSDKGVPLTETSFSKDAFGTVYRSFATNQNGDIVRETDSRGFNTLYTLSESSSQIISQTDRTGAVTEFTYGLNGKPASVSKHGSTVGYEYSSLGNLEKINRGDGMKYNIEYDNNGNLSRILLNDSDDSLCDYTYSSADNLKYIYYANGDNMEVWYNAKGQVIAEKWYDETGEIVTADYKYIYDNDGNLVRSIDLLLKKEYDYIYTDGNITAANEYRIILSGEIVTNKTLLSSISLVYDKDGNLKSKIYNDTEIKISEDETETVVSGKKYTSRSKTDGLSRKLYDELVLPKTTLYRKFDYADGQITAEHKQNGKVVGTPTTNLVKSIQYPDGTYLEYEYDGEERITKVTEKQGDTVVNTTEYTYDAHGQLLTETVNGTVKNAMTYDGYGNILTKNGVVYTYGDPSWKDLLTSVGDNAIAYDAQGNPTSYFGKTLSWQKGRQLKSIGSAEFEYNANGIRTKKKAYSVTHNYTLDGSKILRETFGTNTIIPLYDNEDNVCGINFGGSNYFFVKNLQGDVIKITDEDANVVVKYSYDAWGKPTTVSDTSGISLGYYNPYRYRSYYYDVETKLYYLQSRYYDPEVGRFISADEPMFLGEGYTMQSYTLFGYCDNDCINNLDTYGSFKIDLSSLLKSIIRYKTQKLYKQYQSLLKQFIRRGTVAIARQQYPWLYYVPFAAQVARLRIELSLFIIEKYKDTIKRASEKFKVPAEIIAAIILKEQFTRSIPDNVANIHTVLSFFITKVYNMTNDDNEKDKDYSTHSTGLGAIFPRTAIKAWNYWNSYLPDNEKITVPESNLFMQIKLTNDAVFNINSIAVVLLYEACKWGSIYRPDQAKNMTEEQWKYAVEKYNGAKVYADLVWEYLPSMKILLRG